jgi:hypothetical protein
MREIRHGLVALLVAGLSVPSAFAQSRHAVDPSVVAGVVREHVRELEADRAVIRDMLARPEVKTVASSAGFDVQRLQTAVDTMSRPDLARAAKAARAVDSSLVGGASSITLSTTTVIIGLLILILIIVAVR